jgi:hypothetical protein
VPLERGLGVVEPLELEPQQLLGVAVARAQQVGTSGEQRVAAARDLEARERLLHLDAQSLQALLDGRVTLFQPGTEVALAAGGFFFARRGIPHTYRVGEAGARCLVASSPAGFERFVLAVAALAEPTPERLGAVAAEYDIESLGPPGTLPS